jgi:predicted MFS family arabinose efflux permease
MLVAGKLGDRYGRRRIFKIGLTVSCIGLAACSLAPSFELLLPARVAQGLGTALAIACGPALATSLYPESERPRIVGYYAAMFAAAGAVGPVVGGALTDAFGWQGVFWFRIPLAGMVLALSWLLPADKARVNDGKPFDILGAVLLVIALIALAATLSLIRRGEGGAALAIAALGIIAAAGFIRTERRAADPVLRLDAFRSPRFALLNALNIVVSSASFTPLLFTPFFLTRYAGFDAATGGLALASGAVGTTIAAALAGRMLKTMSSPSVAALGAATAAVGLFLVGRVDSASTMAEVIATLAVAGAGLGFFQTAYLDGVTAGLPESERGVAGGLAMATRTIGVVAAASMLTLLFGETEAAALADGAGPEQAFGYAYALAFAAAATAAAAGAILAWTMRRST